MEPPTGLDRATFAATGSSRCADGSLCGLVWRMGQRLRTATPISEPGSGAGGSDGASNA
jgi:hypothetical protein